MPVTFQAAQRTWNWVLVAVVQVRVSLSYLLAAIVPCISVHALMAQFVAKGNPILP